MIYRLSTGIVEHVTDLGSKSRDDCGVEEGIKSCQNYTADNNADDDLDAGIDVTFTLLGFECCLCGNGNCVYLVTDRIEKLLHVCLPFNLSFILD